MGTRDHRKRRLSRFKKVWTKDEEIGEVTGKSWEMPSEVSYVTYNFSRKLWRLRKMLIRQEKISFSCVRRKKEEINKIIKELEVKEEDEEINKNEAIFQKEKRKELTKTLKREEIMWRQRSRITWLKEEDQNMIFFFIKLQIIEGGRIQLTPYR